MFIDKNGVLRLPKDYLAVTEIFYPNNLETQEIYHKLCGNSRRRNSFVRRGSDL